MEKSKLKISEPIKRKDAPESETEGDKGEEGALAPR